MCRRIQLALSMSYFVYLNYQIYTCFSQIPAANNSNKVSKLKTDLFLKNPL